MSFRRTSSAVRPHEGGELMATTNQAKTLRNLRRLATFGNAPFVSWTTGQRVLTVWGDGACTTPGSMDLKPGSTIYAYAYGVLATIQGGAGGQYLTDQPFQNSTSGGSGLYYSDQTAAKGRDSANVEDSNDV